MYHGELRDASSVFNLKSNAEGGSCARAAAPRNKTAPHNPHNMHLSDFIATQ
jgi:hypothetical protein